MSTSAEFVPVPAVISHPLLARVQRRHFVLFDVIPLAAVVMLVPFWSYLQPRPIDLVVLVVLWTITGIGVTVGLHRYFAHRSFKTGAAGRTVLAVFGMIAAVGPVLSWVAIHRRHHELSDEAGDPHSPNRHGAGVAGVIRGLLHAQLGWIANHEYPNPNRYVRDLQRDSWLVRLDRWYLMWVAIGLIAPGMIALGWDAGWPSFARGVLWGGVLRLAFTHHAISSINSICHVFGSRRYDTPEHSTNVAWLALPTLGEAWHNNHHACQSSATFQHRWWELDPGAAIIRVAEMFGLVWDVRRPAPNPSNE